MNARMIVAGVTFAILGGAAQVADAQSTREVTFTKDVAPIFQARCQQCHHAGTGAPMALMTA